MNWLRSNRLRQVAAALVLAGLVAPDLLKAQEPQSPPWRWSPGVGESVVEVVMVFIGSPDSPANADPGFGDMVRAVKAHLAQVASETDRRFAAVGLSLGWDPREGIDYLLNGVTSLHLAQDLGPWDEVHAGRNWLNEVVVDRIWRADEDSGELPISGFPQILILTRGVKSHASQLRFDDDRVLRRLIGTRAIRAWLDQGGPL